jgi:hypothetical protein
MAQSTYTSLSPDYDPTARSSLHVHEASHRLEVTLDDSKR